LRETIAVDEAVTTDTGGVSANGDDVPVDKKRKGKKKRKKKRRV
jgi:hypothetical protein